MVKHLLTGSLKNRSIDNLETQKKSISMKNSQFFANLKHNSCKIYLKILQVVSKGRKISWLAGGVIGYDSERGPHQDHSTKVWL
jgi:hypothetical protein